LGRPGEISRSVESDYYLELLELADEEYLRILENFPFNFRIVNNTFIIPKNQG
jgi:intergrase/recombinase